MQRKTFIKSLMGLWAFAGATSAQESQKIEVLKTTIEETELNSEATMFCTLESIKSNPMRFAQEIILMLEFRGKEYHPNSTPMVRIDFLI